MQFPITRYQLVAAVESYGFLTNEAERIVTDLETENRIELTGSMLHIPNPTDPDSLMIAGLCKEARGATAGHVSNDKIREYLKDVLQRAATHGSSRRG